MRMSSAEMMVNFGNSENGDVKNCTMHYFHCIKANCSADSFFVSNAAGG